MNIWAISWRRNGERAFALTKGASELSLPRSLASTWRPTGQGYSNHDPRNWALAGGSIWAKFTWSLRLEQRLILICAPGPPHQGDDAKGNTARQEEQGPEATPGTPLPGLSPSQAVEARGPPGLLIVKVEETSDIK